MVEVEGQTQAFSNGIIGNLDVMAEQASVALSLNQPQPNDITTIPPQCPDCGTKRVFKDGFRKAPSNAISNEPIQRFRCADYGHRWSAHIDLKVKDNYKKDSQIGAKAKNLTSTQEIQTCAEKRKHLPTENEVKATPQLTSLLEQLANDGKKPGTIKNYRKAFSRLLKEGADLYNPESAKATLAKAKLRDSTKKTIAAILAVWFDYIGISCKTPKYSAEHEIPFIPTEELLDVFIASLGKKMATYCQILKETGCRAGEASNLTWSSIDFQQHLVRIKPEKGSNPRILPLSLKVLEMLSNISKSSHDNQQNIFANADDMRTNLFLQRRRVAKKLADPRILQIHFHTFRHWKATFEQHKTKDPWHVKTILGHKSISSTETYIHIEEMMYLNQNDNFTVRVANTLEEAIKLMEVGYEFHIEIDGNKLFRKRK